MIYVPLKITELCKFSPIKASTEHQKAIIHYVLRVDWEGKGVSALHLMKEVGLKYGTFSVPLFFISWF